MLYDQAQQQNRNFDIKILTVTYGKANMKRNDIDSALKAYFVYFDRNDKSDQKSDKSFDVQPLRERNRAKDEFHGKSCRKMRGVYPSG